ncbi:MAG: hypothetical protein ACKPKO_32545, partial [Candidatus Fonsibacter sp.]
MAQIAETDRLAAETFKRSLAGSCREGTLRCLLDLSGTFPDRPANVPQIARGQCRSLPEEPNRVSRKDLPMAVSAPRSIRPGESREEEEEAEDKKEAAPITHALFIRDKEELPSAPFPMKQKIDPSDSGYKLVTPVGSAINRL